MISTKMSRLRRLAVAMRSRFYELLIPLSATCKMIPREALKKTQPNGTSPHRLSEPTDNELVVVGTYRQSGREVKLRSDAARALLALMAQARNDGVGIIPISGFRTVAYQETLFQKAVAKYGSEDAAVRWVGRP